MRIVGKIVSALLIVFLFFLILSRSSRTRHMKETIISA